MHESIRSMPQPADRSLVKSPISISTLSTLPLNSLSELPLMSTSHPVADEAAMDVMQVDVGIPNGWHKRPYSPRRTWLRLRSLCSALLHRYFFPAATTLCLNTGLPILLSVLEKGFMMAFSHTSKTSPKNCLIASSVCGLVGLFGMLVLLEDEAPRPGAPVEVGSEV